VAKKHVPQLSTSRGLACLEEYKARLFAADIMEMLVNVMDMVISL
jgi:hypothetical protein